MNKRSCSTCEYLDQAEHEDFIGEVWYYCRYPIILPEIAKKSFIENEIDNPYSQGTQCLCYVLDKSRK